MQIKNIFVQIRFFLFYVDKKFFCMQIIPSGNMCLLCFGI